MGTALVVTVMTSRTTALVGEGLGPVAAQLQGLRWAFAVGAGLCVVVVGLAALLPNRIDDARGSVDQDEVPLARESSDQDGSGVPETV
jgi:DHA2 family lincomycin resistance protein-like MFS transporter